MMMWFYILGTLIMLFFLFKNVHSNGEYKKYSQNAIIAFHDTRKSHQISRILFRILFVLFLVLLLVALLVWHVQQPDTLLCLLCLTIGSALLGFFPFTPGRWVLTDQGIYIYNSSIFIPWSQVIGTQLMPRGKKTYLILNLKQRDGEHLKKTMYPLLIPSEQAMTVSHMISDFVNMLEKKRYRKQLNKERSVPLKDRKFY